MHNYIHPTYLSLFNIAAAPCLNKTSDEIVSADGIIHLENIEPMNFSKVFHYCGKQIGQFSLYFFNLKTNKQLSLTYAGEYKTALIIFVL